MKPIGKSMAHSISINCNNSKGANRKNSIHQLFTLKSRLPASPTLPEAGRSSSRTPSWHLNPSTLPTILPCPKGWRMDQDMHAKVRWNSDNSNFVCTVYISDKNRTRICLWVLIRSKGYILYYIEYTCDFFVCTTRYAGTCNQKKPVVDLFLFFLSCLFISYQAPVLLYHFLMVLFHRGQCPCYLKKKENRKYVNDWDPIKVPPAVRKVLHPPQTRSRLCEG